MSQKLMARVLFVSLLFLTGMVRAEDPVKSEVPGAIACPAGLPAEPLAMPERTATARST